MPCGQFDKRRGGHRCSACRRGHQRCDGQQPCSNCQQRGTDCIFPRRTTRLQVVLSTVTPCKALTINPWKYVCLCFEAVGILPQSAVFRSDIVIGLSHSNEQVNRTWCIVGQVYAARSGKDTLDKEQRDTIYQTLATQTAACARQLKRSSKTIATVPLLCASLLAVTDLLLDDTGDHWRTRMAHISEPVGVIVNDVLQLAPLDRELIRLFQLNDVLGSVSRREHPLGPDFSEAMLKTRCTSTSTDSVTSCTSYDRVLSAMWKWSVLQQRIMHWVSDISCHRGGNHNNKDYDDDDEDNDSDDDNRDNRGSNNNVKYMSLQDKIQGIELVDEATCLQSFILRVLLPSPSSSKPNYQYLDPYCRWILVSISQALQQQVIAGLECDLPIMPSTCLHQQALAALDDIEKTTTNSALDICFFLPVVDAVSTGIDSAGDHARLLHFLDNVEARGFGVAREYRQEILDKEYYC